MSKGVAYAITIVVCLILQAGLAPAITIMGCTPCFLLIPVCLIALHSSTAVSSIAAFLLGLFFDLFTSGPTGCMALTFIILAVLLGVITRNGDKESALLMLVIAIASAVFTELVYGIAVVLTNVDGTGTFVTLLTNSLPTAVYSAVFLIIALITMSKTVRGEQDAAGIFGSSSGYSMKGSKYTLKFK